MTVLTSDTRDRIEDNARAQAAWYMGQKGYGPVEPDEVERLQDQLCWYFFYELPDGELELEVFYDTELQPQIRVTTFTSKYRMQRLGDNVDA